MEMYTWNHAILYSCGTVTKKMETEMFTVPQTRNIKVILAIRHRLVIVVYISFWQAPSNHNDCML